MSGPRIYLVPRGETRMTGVETMPVSGLVGALVALIHRLRDRYLAGSVRRVPKQMCVIETLAIGPRKQLVLVSCGAERFLVGTGQDNVQNIVQVRAESAPVAAAKPVTDQQEWL